MTFWNQSIDCNKAEIARKGNSEWGRDKFNTMNRFFLQKGNWDQCRPFFLLNSPSRRTAAFQFRTGGCLGSPGMHDFPKVRTVLPVSASVLPSHENPTNYTSYGIDKAHSFTRLILRLANCWLQKACKYQEKYIFIYINWL